MNEPNQDKTPDVLQSDASIAEAKRLAARRRFLGRGTAAASGLVIVTLCHQRAFAKKPAPAPWVPPQPNPVTGQQTALAGSAALCQSLGAHAVVDVTTSAHGSQRVDCTGF